MGKCKMKNHLKKYELPSIICIFSSKVVLSSAKITSSEKLKIHFIIKENKISTILCNKSNLFYRYSKVNSTVVNATNLALSTLYHSVYINSLLPWNYDQTYIRILPLFKQVSVLAAIEEMHKIY